MPKFLNPLFTIKDCDLGNLPNMGAGFPLYAWLVRVPTVPKPNPNIGRTSVRRAS